MAAAPPELAARFHARFAGLERSHGRYFYFDPDSATIDPRTHSGDGKKNDGEGKLVYAPATEDLWAQHLGGSYSLGMCPIRDDATCVWGAIDVDKYQQDLVAFAQRVTASELPLIPCRTKSGGVHLYCFTEEPVAAELMRVKLLEWASALGFPSSEVFPKQSALAGPSDHGSWINMPYYEATDTLRFALGPNGEKINAGQFLDLADAIAVSWGLLEATQPLELKNLGERWDGAPPCLQTLAIHGFGEGARNRGLFNVGVYLRKRHGDDDWAQHFDSYHGDYFSPPLPHKEVGQVQRNVGKKVYQYTCNEEPISRVCQRQICLTRKYGIGRHNDDDPGVTFGPLVKINTKPDPTWLWDVNGFRIELETADLKEQRLFHTRVINELNIWPKLIKPGQWAEIVRERLKTVEVVEAPPDASVDGQLLTHLREFCTGRPNAKQPIELLHGKPYVENGRVYFHGPTFMTYLSQQRVNIKDKRVWAILRANGADDKFWNFKGRGINTWHMPAFDQTDLNLPTPGLDGDDDDPM